MEHYLRLEGQPITRAIAEQRMLEKLNYSLSEDIIPLVPVGIDYDENRALVAFDTIWTVLISRIKGEPWKLAEQTLAEFHRVKSN
ncbi:MAG: hypothetical protein LBR29_06100 [Methylobacteriaceae bacterium]|jgi:hypothetical protein|nr:hypothetical protein [Methylobacteriaceae bacterium]